MDKRYQVFVSSTYTDLVEERRHVTQALLELDCIPAGMEMFPAVDEEQFEFIKTVIDKCDYYILIIAGRYGTLAQDGLSYTEKEFDYAIKKGIPVITLVHGKPETIESGKTEETDKGKEQLKSFRKKAREGRLSKDWTTPGELAGLVSRSLYISFNRHPAVGWIRGDKAASAEILNEVNELRKENASLKNQIAKLKTRPLPKDLAKFDDTFVVRGSGYVDDKWSPSLGKMTTKKISWKRELPWKKIFELVGPYLLEHPNDSRAKDYFEKALDDHKTTPFYLDDQSYQTIKIQLEAYGLIDIKYTSTTSGGAALFLNLTPHGRATLSEVRTHKVKASEAENV